MSCTACAGCSFGAGLVALTGVGAAVSLIAGGTGFTTAQQCVPRLGATSESCSPNVVSGGQPMSCAGIRASQGFGYTTYMHTGIDLVCGPGTPVVSISAGTFYRRQDSSRVLCPTSLGPGLRGGYGLYGVVTEGSGVQLLYAHLEGFAAADGSVVSPGDVLGFEGATGCATGFHLHFEARVGGRPVNPCGFLAPNYPAVHEPTSQRCWGGVPP